MSDHFVIVGNGTAGFRAAKTLREADRSAQISVFTEERYPFYLRHQLGDFFAGDASAAELVFQSRNAYRRERIDLFLMTPVVQVEPVPHEVVLVSGERVRYDRALVATGTQAVTPQVRGMDLAGVVRLDTLGRAIEAGRRLHGVRQAVFIDEGVVSLAVAEGLARQGIEVTLLAGGDRYWPQMLDPQTGEHIENLLDRHGIAVRRRATARTVVGAGGRALGVELEDGAVISAELVAYGSRRAPRLDLVRDTSIETAGAIRVDQRFATSARDVFAAGDAAIQADSPSLDEPFFCWQRSWTHGELAGRGMLDQGTPAWHDTLRTRMTLLGTELAVIGAGHLPAEGDVDAIELRDDPTVVRRLVFRGGRLVGAVVLGTGQGVPDLARMVAEGVPREKIEMGLEQTGRKRRQEILPQTFAQHCPICAAELAVRQGTRVGARVVCRACNVELIVCWNGERGWLEVGRH